MGNPNGKGQAVWWLAWDEKDLSFPSLGRRPGGQQRIAHAPPMCGGVGWAVFTEAKWRAVRCLTAMSIFLEGGL